MGNHLIFKNILFWLNEIDWLIDWLIVLNDVFWYYVKGYIFLKFIQYTIYSEKTQRMKNFASGEINVTKNALFFSLASLTSSQFYF